MLIPDVDTALFAQADQKKESLGFNLDSGVQLTRSLDVQGRYRREMSDQDFRSSGQTRSLDITWPAGAAQMVWRPNP